MCKSANFFTRSQKVIRINGTWWLSVPAATAWLFLSSFCSSWCAAQNTYSSTAPKPSFGQSVKNSFNKIGDTFSSKPAPGALPPDDPTLLSSKGKPSVDLYISVAKLHEGANRIPQAEEQYQLAMREYPNHLVAMLSYAHFLENQGRYEDAVNQYQRTIKAHPKNASVHNNLGLCHARKKKLKEATTALNQAVQLEPRNPLYRNNISALLVEQNRLSEAFDQLRDVHGEAKAYYNLGYLLSKKGDTASAEHHFKQALRIDPTMESAHRWLSYMQNNSQPSAIDRNFKIVQPSSADSNPPQEQVASRPMMPPMIPAVTPMVNTSAPRQNPYYSQQRQTAPTSEFIQERPTLPESAPPRRLPPVVVRQPIGSAGPANVADASESAPAAPLPPGASTP
jgi:Tfp pilus assembly protein PilF